MFQTEKDHDPFAEYKRPTIADRQSHNPYLDKANAAKRMMSPARLDPFADGMPAITFYCSIGGFYLYWHKRSIIE